MKSLLLFVVLITASSAQTNLQFVNGFFTNIEAQRVIPLANGNHVVIGAQTVSGPMNADGEPTTRSALLIYSINTAGTQDLNFGPSSPATVGGSGNDVASDAVADAKGNIWIVGATDSDDFPLVNAIVSQKAAYRTSGFVLELDPAGRKILFSSYLGGHKIGNGQPFSKATNLAIGANGNAYILGNTSESDFPTTPGVFGTPASLVNGFLGEVYSWIVQISAAGAMQYSTFLGGSQSNCQSGNGCVAILARNIGEAITVDAAGNVTVSGVTSALDFPTTPGVFQGQCQCIPGNFAGFISRIAPDASRLVWSTYFGGLYLGSPPNLLIATDLGGNVFVFGRSQPPGLAQNSLNLPPDLVAGKLRPDGTGLVYMTDLGESNDADLAGIVVDSNGNALMAGTDSSPQLAAFPNVPGNVPSLGSDFVLELDPTGAHPQILYRLLTGTVTQAPVIDASGNLLLLSNQGSLLELSGNAPLPQSGILGVGNSATYTMSTGFAAGELVSLYGIGLGPSQAVTATPNATGFPTQLNGVQVMIAGSPAPLLYVGPNQINLQIPFETTMGYIAFPAVEVNGPSGKLTFQANALPSPGLFYAGTPPNAAALNEDGSVNSASNPAKPGSVVALFGTGAVLASGGDGELAPSATPLSQQANHFQVFDNYGNELALLYVGAAPGLSDGIFQINVQVPAGDLDPTLTLRSATIFGTASSNSVRIYVE
jgi:uncharacterized protein (TIGR03437 family)